MKTIANQYQIRRQIRSAEAFLQSSRFPACTYEYGVLQALSWVLGEEDDLPMGEWSEQGQEEV